MAPRDLLHGQLALLDSAGGETGNLDILFPSDALDDQVGRDVHDQRHQYQQRADDEERLIVLAALDRLARLRRDRGGQRP